MPSAQDRVNPAKLITGAQNRAQHLKGIFTEFTTLGAIVCPFSSPKGQVHFSLADPRDLILCSMGLFVSVQNVEEGEEGEVALFHCVELDTEVGGPGDVLYLHPGGEYATTPHPEGYPISIGSILGVAPSGLNFALLNPPGCNIIGLYRMLEGE